MHYKIFVLIYLIILIFHVHCLTASVYSFVNLEWLHRDIWRVSVYTFWRYLDIVRYIEHHWNEGRKEKIRYIIGTIWCTQCGPTIEISKNWSKLRSTSPVRHSYRLWSKDRSWRAWVTFQLCVKNIYLNYIILFSIIYFYYLSFSFWY